MPHTSASWAPLPSLTNRALLSDFIQVLFVKYEVLLYADTIVMVEVIMY